MKYVVLLLLVYIVPVIGSAQISSGTTGLLNIPTAEMQTSGTFMFGGNYLPEAFTSEELCFNTANYYFNITFLPFLELTYRMTFLKMNDDDLSLNNIWDNNQDRTFGLRMRLLNEKKYLPAFVIGGNDVLRSDYFSKWYAVASKTIVFNENRVAVTLGAAINDFSNSQSARPFAGIELSPKICKQLSLIAEYDTDAFNMGASVLLFNHLYMNAFVYDYQNIMGGFAYKIYLK